MLEFCPLCMRNGRKMKIRIFQLNLEDAVWACEAPDCIWPIGYEDLTFCQSVPDFRKKDRGETSSSTENVLNNTKEKSSSRENGYNSNNTFPLTSKKLSFLEEIFATETSSSKENVPSHTEETSLSKDNILIPMELSLYTPPVTPAGGEFYKEVNMGVSSPENFPNLTEDKSYELPNLTEDEPDKVSKDESISSVKKSKRSFNHPSLPGLSEVEGSNLAKKNKTIGREGSEKADKILPKITNIEKTNIDLKIYPDKTECDDKTAQDGTKQECTEEQSLMDTLAAEVAKDYNILIDSKRFGEIGLDRQRKENKDESNENQITQRLQSDNIERATETNLCVETVSGASSVINTCVNLDTSNTLNISSSDLNFEEILNDISPLGDDMMEKIDTEWLDLLES